MSAALRWSLSAGVLFTLIGCSGGGGGGGAGSAGIEQSVHVPFSAFSAIAPRQTVTISGTSETSGGTHVTASDGSRTVNSVNDPLPSSATIQLAYDEARALRSLSLSTAQSSLTLDRTSGALSCGNGVCAGSNAAGAVTVMDPLVQGWNYQTFGVWTMAGDASTWAVGALSVGKPTAPMSVPTTGNAIFVGQARGFYVDAIGSIFTTSAAMSANVDFGNRNVVFNTTNTMLTNRNTGLQAPGAGLNLSGNLSILPGSAVSGTVSTANGQLIGGTTGSFYGPSAEEIGGTYRLLTPQRAAGANPSDLSTMVGAFGGRR